MCSADKKFMISALVIGIFAVFFAATIALAIDNRSGARVEASASASSESADHKDDQERKDLQKKQSETMGNLFYLATGITAYNHLRGEYPRSLDELFATDQVFVYPEKALEY